MVLPRRDFDHAVPPQAWKTKRGGVGESVRFGLAQFEGGVGVALETRRIGRQPDNENKEKQEKKSNKVKEGGQFILSMSGRMEKVSAPRHGARRKSPWRPLFYPTACAPETIGPRCRPMLSGLHRPSPPPQGGARTNEARRPKAPPE